MPTFQRAQQIIADRHRRYSDEEMLQMLRALLEQKKTLSGVLIDEAENMPSKQRVPKPIQESTQSLSTHWFL